MSQLSISKSVGRAFEVLEYFRNTGVPCSTGDLEKALNYPYSSLRAILLSLSNLGYLKFDRNRKTYFPTQQLLGLGNWMQNAMLRTAGLLRLVEAVRSRVNETAALATPNFIFCNVFEVRIGTRPMSMVVPAGVGLTLTHSASGRVLLSQMQDVAVDAVIRHTQYWIGQTHAPIVAERAEIIRGVHHARANGSFSDYGGFTTGGGTIAYALPSPLIGSPIALFVSGPTQRVQQNEAKIRRAIEMYLSAYRSELDA